MSNAFVVLMGMGTVFVGLICIIFVCMIMSALVRSFQKTPDEPQNQEKQNNTSLPSPAAVPEAPITPEFVAAVTTAIAEYSGKDFSGIRIHSIKKVGQSAQVCAPADTSAGSPGFIAAITAAIAEYTGKDYSGIRILSIKKI